MSQQAELFTPGRRLTQLAQQKPDEIALTGARIRGPGCRWRLVNAKDADRPEKSAQQPHWGEVLKKRDERVQRERLAAKRRRRELENRKKAG